MPHVTFIYPCMGRRKGQPYVRSWQMEPLGIGVLAQLTPDTWERTFFDDRLENIDYEIKTDVVALSVETYTARRAYQIARRFRAKGVPVIMGGYHPTLCPECAQNEADAICIGEAESIWQTILTDIEKGTLKPRYQGRAGELRTEPDRSIFAGKNYLNLTLCETGRGCPFDCDFCSITAFSNQCRRSRKVEDIIAEIRRAKRKRVFFVDDNLTIDRSFAKELFAALKPLRIQWISQVSIDVAQDSELVKAMRESGCLGVLIGFESLSKDVLAKMSKSVNRRDYTAALKVLRKEGIAIYGTFMFGYEGESFENFENTVRFATQEGLFLAAFNHVVPFPGTRLYERLLKENKLRWNQWWLKSDYRFGQTPADMSTIAPEAIEEACMNARRKFYKVTNTIKRAGNRQANLRTPLRGFTYFAINLMMRREVSEKFGTPLGLSAEDEP